MPSRIGKYEILRRLGQGAMGEVFLARDPSIGREVAIKTISALQAQGEEARERFLREARAAGALSHPHLVTIHEFGEDQGLLYLVMEHVPGEDLHALLARNALPPRDSLEILAQVCEGLAYAHQRGVLHRDVKPSNIRVARHGDRPFAKVMDFGIARVAGSDFTGTGTLLGTFGYMAPEYIQTGRANPRSDLFAVGVILYEALAGERPFQGDTTATILYRIVHETPRDVDLEKLRGVSPAVQSILSRALAKDPHERFGSGEDLAAALRAARDPSWRGFPDPDATVATSGSRTRPSAATRILPPGPPSRKWVGWFTAAAVLLALAAGGGSLYRWRGGPRAGASQPPPTPEPPKVHPAPAAVEVPEPSPTPVPESRGPGKGQAPSPLPREQGAPAPLGPSIPQERAISSLDGAAAALQADPEGASRYLDRFLAEDPGNARARALRLVAFYDMSDPQGFALGLKASHDNGVPLKLLLANPRFRQMLKREAETPRLPPRLHRALLNAPAVQELRGQEALKGRRSESP